jgi:DNA-binding NarL/FixJ family response regulator
MKHNKGTLPAPTAKPFGITVLVVDDHSLLRRGIVSRLESEEGIQVVGQSNAAGALEAMKSLKPDIVVVDMTIRGAAGLDLVKLLAYDPRHKLLVIDLTGGEAYGTRAIRSGAKGYISNEAEEILPQAIRRVHSGSLYVSDGVAQQMVQALTQAVHAEPIDNLSDRELEMAELMGQGLSTMQLAERMGISIKTVETHKAHMKKKLSISKASQLARFCVAWVEKRNTKAHGFTAAPQGA